MILNLTKNQAKVLDRIIWGLEEVRFIEQTSYDTLYDIRSKFAKSAKKAGIVF